MVNSFIRSNEGSLLELITECQLANDVAFLAITYHEAEQALLAIVDLDDKFGLTSS